MILDDIIKNVQAKLDDPDGTYITPDYVMGFTQDAYVSLYNKLRASGFQFDEAVVVLPGVQAGSPNLDGYMSSGKPLEMIVTPRLVEWRLPGQPETAWRTADGPLAAVRDLPPNVQRLDSWAWIRRSLKLSAFATALDLRITGEFMFNALSAADSPILMDITIGPAFTLAVTLAVAKARGGAANKAWIQTYGPDYIEEVDNLFIEMTKAQQAMPFRVARSSRRGANLTSPNLQPN